MPGETARDCLNVPRVQTPDVCEELEISPSQNPRREESFTAELQTPDVASSILHGVTTTSSQNKMRMEKQRDKGTKVVSKRVDDFRERTQPQLGTVHDPIRDTMNVTPDHSFGILIRPDEYGAGDLIHSRLPGEYLRGKDRQRGLLAAVRQQLKKANYHNFNNLQAAFKHYDKNGDGKIDVMELRECCLQFNLPVETELLEELIHYCDEKGEGAIDYTEFANFLNWKDKMVQNPGSADGANKSEVGTPERLNKQIDGAVGQHRTSSSRISAVVGGVSTKDFRKYGTPTIRSDLPAPRIKRISDLTNYGDEADALGLINPSIYSNRGVYEKDFFQPRSQEQIQTFSRMLARKWTMKHFRRFGSLRLRMAMESQC
ncbi:putative EF-hand domain-containing family member B [Apostichopus japonicus]|uniref:Putative EF-hand domain-containing family member B n=1 Tax=Stichopus japonicus TaxID=307972 RepID=A0A2G8KWZ9_STIJA|nr:putative EF-hand domain-containing family member B [Apostichopus japonicus]